MKSNKVFILFALSFIFFLSSCSTNSKRKEVVESTDQYNNENNHISEEIVHEIGVPYEVGITPDDYNMDYDTSRLKQLNEKKSSYYPEEGVKGIYLNASSIIDPIRYDKIINLLDSTDLNAVVIDIKDDWGNINTSFDTENEDILFATSSVINAEEFIDTMHKKDIYVIGRIPTFKDSVITKLHPDLGFNLKDGGLWSNSSGEVFINPFDQKARDYIINIAKLAAKAGFDEIQFDYIRFAEGFETFSDSLEYTRGEWKNLNMTEGEKRIDAITSFVRRAREELQQYNIPVSIDVFGYAMQVGRAEGIGQDFAEMSNETDVISSMIYPSHWSQYSFDIEKPDLEPYNLVLKYMEEEKEVLSEIDYQPQSRPWLQDFTATWIGEGNWMEYDSEAVQAQIDAIYDSGHKEFLLWNAAGEYTEGVDY